LCPSSAVEQALELFSDDLLEHLLVQGEIRHQPAQPGVLLFQLPELPHLRGQQAPELLLPAVKGLLANAHLAGNLGHLGALLGLLPPPVPETWLTISTGHGCAQLRQAPWVGTVPTLTGNLI
jgi:hypothetical protein